MKRPVNLTWQPMVLVPYKLKVTIGREPSGNFRAQRDFHNVLVPSYRRIHAPDRSLPASEFYIVHPVLDAWLSELSPDYARHLDTLNIAGYNRTWRDRTGLRGTLAADIVDYTRIMLNADLFRVFVHDLRKVAQKHCQNLEFFEVIQGRTDPDMWKRLYDILMA